MGYNPDEECDRIIKNIRMLCELKSMSQHAVAVKAEISSSTIHCLMTGKTKPYVHTLFKLCNALDVSVEDILRIDSQTYCRDGELTDDERELLLGYRCLKLTKRERLKEYLEMLQKFNVK